MFLLQFDVPSIDPSFTIITYIRRLKNRLYCMFHSLIIAGNRKDIYHDSILPPFYVQYNSFWGNFQHHTYIVNSTNFVIVNIDKHNENYKMKIWSSVIGGPTTCAVIQWKSVVLDRSVTSNTPESIEHAYRYDKWNRRLSSAIRWTCTHHEKRRFANSSESPRNPHADWKLPHVPFLVDWSADAKAIM